MKFEFVMVSPVRNESRFIEKTINSVLSQSAKPRRWVIVNDGSDDDTASIVQEKSKGIDWIQLVNAPVTRQRQRGGRIVRLFNLGYSLVKDVSHEIVVKLDGDIAFAPDYFHRLLSEFSKRRRLGISSGISFIPRGGSWVEERSSRGHTLGASKVYRRQCLEEIGGLMPVLGWDGIDEIRARMLGWEAESIPELVVRHYRPEGSASGLVRRFWEDGEAAHFMGYHSLYMVARAFWRMKSFPYVLGGMAMLFGYVNRGLVGARRIADRDFVDFVKKQQCRKLLMKKSLL